MLTLLLRRLLRTLGDPGANASPALLLRDDTADDAAPAPSAWVVVARFTDGDEDDRLSGEGVVAGDEGDNGDSLER